MIDKNQLGFILNGIVFFGTIPSLIIENIYVQREKIKNKKEKVNLSNVQDFLNARLTHTNQTENYGKPVETINDFNPNMDNINNGNINNVYE